MDRIDRTRRGNRRIRGRGLEKKPSDRSEGEKECHGVGEKYS